MQLAGANSTVLRLSIVGYAYPGVERREHYNPYHEDFLTVSIEVTTARGSWKATQPTLLTMEARELAKWFRLVSDGAEPGENIEFFDPLLYFEYGGERGARIVLRVGFGLEFRPPWAKRNQVDVQDFLFDFEVTPEDLKSAASSLAAELEPFPTRWNPR